MKTMIHDLGETYNEQLLAKADQVIHASGRYAPCQGCFKCWTKTPAACAMKDTLQQICRIVGASDDLTIITENCYGAFSQPVKNIIDRSIGTSTPFSTYRKWQMHHTLRYGKHGHLQIIVYGDINENERHTLSLMAERNAINYGFTSHSIEFCAGLEEAGGKA